MRKIGILLLVLLLCVSLFACAEVENAQNAFLRSPEGRMIGRTFREVEAAFGPFSLVYFEQDHPAAYIFGRSNVAFYFDAPQVQDAWAKQLANGVGYIPGAVALRDIQPGDVCVGVSGRIRDFGVADSDVAEISRYMASLRPASVETSNNTVYMVTTTDQAYDVYLYCAKGEVAVTSDHQVRIMAAGTEAQQEINPVADPNVTEFSFGGTVIPVNETRVEVRGDSAAHRTVTAKEFSDLVLYCPHLKTLILDYCDVSGEEQLGQLTELTYLEIMTCAVSDVSFVQELTNLTHLGLCHNDISDVTPLEELKLTYLNIADNPKLGNSAVRSVAKITTLNELYLYSLNISELSALKMLRHLNTLNINNDSRITQKELSKLTKLTRLHTLQINGTGVTSLDFLFTDFPNLKALEARRMRKLENRNQSFLNLVAHPSLTKLTLGKDDKDSLDADALANYGTTAEDWFKSHGITVKYR